MRLSRTGLLPKVRRDRHSGLGRPIQFRSVGSGRRGHAGSGSVSGACVGPCPSSDRPPSLHALRHQPVGRCCSRLHRYYAAVRLLRPSDPASAPRLPEPTRDRQGGCGRPESSSAGELHPCDRVTGSGRPPPVPTERGVRLSRTTLFDRWFTALSLLFVPGSFPRSASSSLCIEGCLSLCMEPASPQNESPVASRFPL